MYAPLTPNLGTSFNEFKGSGWSLGNLFLEIPIKTTSDSEFLVVHRMNFHQGVWYIYGCFFFLISFW